MILLYIPSLKNLVLTSYPRLLGWIFQEDHLASKNMVLLIPHSEDLEKEEDFGTDPGEIQVNFGTIPGELQVNLARFRQAVTLFCISMGDEHRCPTSEILGKVKQYNIWNKRVYDSTSTTSSDSDDRQSSNQSSNAPTSTTYSQHTQHPA